MRYTEDEIYKLECRVRVYIVDILGIELYGHVFITKYAGKRNRYYIEIQTLDIHKTHDQIIKKLEDGLGVKGFKLCIEKKDGKYREYYKCNLIRDDLCNIDGMFKMMGFDEYGHNIHYGILAEKQKGI